MDLNELDPPTLWEPRDHTPAMQLDWGDCPPDEDE